MMMLLAPCRRLLRGIQVSLSDHDLQWGVMCTTSLFNWPDELVVEVAFVLQPPPQAAYRVCGLAHFLYEFSFLNSGYCTNPVCLSGWWSLRDLLGKEIHSQFYCTLCILSILFSMLDGEQQQHKINYSANRTFKYVGWPFLSEW